MPKPLQALASRPPAKSGSWENAPRRRHSCAAARWQFNLDDGCGSPAMTPSAPCQSQVLIANYRKNREPFIASLAVGGVDGTLDEDSRRQRHPENRVFAKSGYIVGVSACRAISGQG